MLDGADFANAPPPVTWSAAIGAQIAAVLADVHRVEVVHRDIKPAIVMIVDNGLVKVLDFGISVLRGAGALPRLTQIDRTVGTPPYMSPEQNLGTAVTAASDVYSLGCVLTELLTADPPFHGPSRSGKSAEGSLRPSGRSSRQALPSLVALGLLHVMFAVARMGVALGAVAMLVTGCGGSDSSAPADGRPVAHAMGVSMVSAQPSRVVVLDTQELDAAVSLGVTPVGSTRASVSEELPSFLRGKVAPGSVRVVGTIQDPDLEAIAALQPDLILSSKLRHEKIYPQLQAIAPTVLSERTGDAWKDNLQLYADALGRAPEAQRLLTDYQTRAAELGRRVGAPQTTVSVIRQTPEDLRLYGPRSFVGSVLADAGFARPEAVRNAPKTFVEIGPEQIGQADADVVYATTYGNVPKLSTSPLWGSLSAVRAGRAFEVSDDDWMLAIGPTGADLVLDDLERTLATP